VTVRSAIALFLACIVALGAAACRHVADAPTAIDYDHEACAHCRMLVGDPRYAAQLVTETGDVLYLDEHAPRIHRIWFRDSLADRWLAADAAAFVSGAATPMGYGFAAVARGTSGAVGLDQVRAQLRARRQR
jgi:copper chaperone NosL